MPRNVVQQHEQSALPADQRLAPRELSSLRSMYKFYEHKQYKKVLKLAEQILRKSPKHGETLALKGLALSCLPERKAEAKASCADAVRNFPLSNVCWQLYGLVLKGEHEYVKAVKCFKNALRIEPEHAGMLRDLSWMQLMIRDAVGFTETVNHLMRLQPSAYSNWLALGVGNHLQEEYETAASVLETFIQSQEATLQDAEAGVMLSEVIMYLATVQLEGKDFAGALKTITDRENLVLDKLELSEMRAEIFLRLERWEEAATAFRTLMDSYSPDNYVYHKGVLAALLKRTAIWDRPRTCFQHREAPAGFFARLASDAEATAAAVKYYDALRADFPRSDVAKIISMYLRDASDPEFAAQLDSYARAKLLKGVPSLFADLKMLGSDSAKQGAINSLFEKFSSSLESSSKFAPSDADTDTVPPTVLMWCWYTQAQLIDLAGDTTKALAIVDKCLEHTPTVVEVRQTRGKILKHAGNPIAASVETEKARDMDLQDRFTNVLSAKYLLAANRHDEAVKVVGAFTKQGIDPEKTLDEMQALWFSLGAAAAHKKYGRFGRALKKLHSIETHHQEIVNDQYDFLGYCISRKQTLRALVAMLRFEDTLAGSHLFRDAFAEIAGTYIFLADNPEHLKFRTPQEQEADEQEAMAASLDPAERKKYLRQRRKDDSAKVQTDASKEQQEAAIKAAQQSKNPMNRPSGREAIVDTDPFGLEMLRLADSTPLDEALKRVRTLQQVAPRWSRTHELAADIFLRRRKPVPVLRAIRKLQELVVSDDPAVPVFSAQLFHLLREDASLLESDALRTIFTEAELEFLGGSGVNLVEFLQAWLDEIPARSLDLGVRRRIAAALASVGALDRAKKILLAAAEKPELLVHGHHDLSNVIASHEELVRLFSAEDQEVKKFATASAVRFPHSVYFHPELAIVSQAEENGSVEFSDGEQ